MGLHYVNVPLVLDHVLDPSKPEIIIYEPLPNGRLKMTGGFPRLCRKTGTRQFSDKH